MNWEAIGAIAEILGAAAVVFSVLYLAVQIRENTKQTKFQFDALQQEQISSAHEAFSRFRTLLLSDQSYTSIWLRALESFGTLEDTEKHIADMLFQEYVSSFHLMYLINTTEVSESLDIDDLVNWMNGLLSDILGKAGFQYWWVQGRFRFVTAGFADIVDSAIQNHNGT